MSYGYFDDDHREYVITRPDTPVPWINYLGTDEYFGIVSNTAGGYSWHRDARLHRLTRYRYNNVPGDTGGRHLYLRDDDTGEYWSPSWQPTRTPLDAYECRHGMSYHDQLGQERHQRQDPVLRAAGRDARGLADHRHQYQGHARRDVPLLLGRVRPLGRPGRRHELPAQPYRGFHEPLGVERGELSGSIAHGWSPHGAQHVRLTLQPVEAREVIFLLGYWENPRDDKFESVGVINKAGVRPVTDRWLDPATVTEGLADLKRYWDDLLTVLNVDTLDGDTNRMVNTWNAYQCMVTFNLSRSVSSYETGISRGMGFRDSCQDLLGSVQLAPDRARRRILDLAATQFASGGAYHQYQPLTKTGNDAIGSGFNDDPLWLVLGVAAYLKETGDATIAQEMVPFSDGGAATLYDHMAQSLRYTLDRIGPHGLPLIGRADWTTA